MIAPKKLLETTVLTEKIGRSNRTAQICKASARAT